MDEKDWGDLYEFLLEELRKVELPLTASEIENAATARVVELDDSFDADLEDSTHRPSRRRNLPQERASQPRLIEEPSEPNNPLARTRAPSSYEAFAAALDVLRVHLIEFPALIEKLPELFETELSNISWMPDIEGGGVAAPAQEFSGNGLAALLHDQQTVYDLFRDLETMTHQATQS